MLQKTELGQPGHFPGGGPVFISASCLTQTLSSHGPARFPKKASEMTLLSCCSGEPFSAHGLVSWTLQISLLDLRLVLEAVSDPCCLWVAGSAAFAHGHEEYGFLLSPLGFIFCAPLGLPRPFGVFLGSFSTFRT